MATSATENLAVQKHVQNQILVELRSSYEIVQI